MNIAVIGTGYVGIVTAAVFADFGNHVWGIDVMPQRVTDLKAGKTPIYEPRLEEFLKRGLQSGRLQFTTSYNEGLQDADVIFVCVGTPQQDNGEVDLRYIESSIESVAITLTKPVTIVLKSTVPPGVHKHLTKIMDRHTEVRYEFASVPEFLREGSAIADTLNPPRVVIGTASKRAVDILLDLHRSIPGERVITDIISAQMIKYAANGFLATKISFANAIARICDLVDGDVKAVMQGIGLDPRIGDSFLYPGLGFGGSCFPKDIKGLYHVSKEAGYDFRLLQEVDEINTTQVDYVCKLTEKALGSFQDKQIGILGLAFKPDTDDMREARSIVLINYLLAKGAQVVAYDPIASKVAKNILKTSISYASSALEASQGADAVFVVTEWNEFKELDLTKVKSVMKGDMLVDGRNIYDPAVVKKFGFRYIGVGRR